MALTMIQRRRAQLLAGRAATQAAGPAGAPTGAAATEYELLRAALGVDLRRLHEIQSIESKVALKRELLPRYMPWVGGVLAADAGAQDDVVAWMLVWLIDCEAFSLAMPLIRYVLRHDLNLPERIRRTAPTYISEEIAESALKRLGQEPPMDADDAANMVRRLDDIADLVAGADIFDEVRAKLEKAQGLAAVAAAASIGADADGPAGALAAMQDRAIAHLDRALELNPKAGVKQVRDRIRKARSAEDQA